MILRAIVMAAALAGVLAASAAAQEDPTERSRVSGMALGVFASGSAVRTEGASGAGLGRGMHLGFGFADRFSLILRIRESEVRRPDPGESFSFDDGDLGLRYSFGDAGRALRPFAQAGFNGAFVSFDDSDVQMHGPGLTGGGGVEYFVTRGVAVDAGVSFTVASLTKGRDVDGEFEILDRRVSARGARLEVGVSWHP